MEPHETTDVKMNDLGHVIRDYIKGDDATHVIVVPDANGTYTVKARFDAPPND
jgi:hypothetical protein